MRATAAPRAPLARPTLDSTAPLGQLVTGVRNSPRRLASVEARGAANDAARLRAGAARRARVVPW